MIKRLFMIFILSSSIGAASYAADFWQYPEMADKNALFAGISAAAQIAFKGGFSISVHPEAYIDWLLPIGLPFSFGFSGRVLSPELIGAGIRPAYHINFDKENLDVYVMYTLKADFAGDYTYIEWGGAAGARRLFGRYVCLSVETGFRLQYISLGIAVKLN